MADHNENIASAIAFFNKLIESKPPRQKSEMEIAREGREARVQAYRDELYKEMDEEAAVAQSNKEAAIMLTGLVLGSGIVGAAMAPVMTPMMMRNNASDVISYGEAFDTMADAISGRDKAFRHTMEDFGTMMLKFSGEQQALEDGLQLTPKKIEQILDYASDARDGRTLKEGSGFDGSLATSQNYDDDSITFIVSRGKSELAITVHTDDTISFAPNGKESALDVMIENGEVVVIGEDGQTTSLKDFAASIQTQIEQQTDLGAEQLTSQMQQSGHNVTITGVKEAGGKSAQDYETSTDRSGIDWKALNEKLGVDVPGGNASPTAPVQTPVAARDTAPSQGRA